MAGTFGGNIPGGTNKKSSERAREIMGVEERYSHERVITESHHYGIFTVHRSLFLTFAQHGIVKKTDIL